MVTTAVSRPIAEPRKKQKRANWREDFYRNGLPKEVIVIDDSPNATPNPSYSMFISRQQHQEFKEAKGMKRGRRPSPLPPLSHSMYISTSQSSYGSTTKSSHNNQSSNAFVRKSPSVQLIMTRQVSAAQRVQRENHVYNNNSFNPSKQQPTQIPSQLLPNNVNKRRRKVDISPPPSLIKHAYTSTYQKNPPFTDVTIFPSTFATNNPTYNDATTYFASSFAVKNPTYSDASFFPCPTYRSYISTSSHASTTNIYLNNDGHNYDYNSLQSYSSGTSSGIPQAPVYDDKDGHYIVHPGDDLTTRYKIIRILGQGTFGKVIQCWDRAYNTHVAIKMIRAVEKYRDAAKIEIRVLNCIKQNDPFNVHHCIHLRDYFDFRNHICIVFDLLGSSLYDFLKSNEFNPFPMNQIQNIARQLLTSVESKAFLVLHSMHLIHTDLKPENILLDTDHYRSVPSKGQDKGVRELYNSDIRVIDFGSATFEEEYHSSVIQTRHYRAPEGLVGRILAISGPLAVSSLNYLLAKHRQPQSKFFRNGKLNYPNHETSRQSKQYVRETLSLRELIQPHTCAFNRQFFDLVLGLLHYDPAQRLTAREALRHLFFYAPYDNDGRQLRY
ncbi:9410_t:CDS:2 [Ambispora gerdemannii]|uniref:9410_t:CDS:1 n=1 Tax=Ambispora gerdemannii TaxID=144530 RepID=A0A9N9BT27_9GLOM|nr:9410_t:CDS:2 [Ambispora gerdemannii]